MAVGSGGRGGAGLRPERVPSIPSLSIKTVRSGGAVFSRQISFADVPQTRGPLCVHSFRLPLIAVRVSADSLRPVQLSGASSWRTERMETMRSDGDGRRREASGLIYAPKQRRTRVGFESL